MRWRHRAARTATPAQTVGMADCTVLLQTHMHCSRTYAHFLCALTSSVLTSGHAGENDDEDSEGMSDWEEDNGEDGGEGDDAMSDDGDSSSVSGVSSEEVRLHPAHTMCCPAAYSSAAKQPAHACDSCAALQVQPCCW